MKKIIMFLILFFVSVGTLTGCSSSDPTEIIKEGIDSNEGSKIEKLYSKTDDTDELDGILIKELERKSKEISTMTLEEFKETPYGEILDSKNLESTDLINSGILDVFSFNKVSKTLSDKVIDAETKLATSIIIKCSYNLAMQYEAGKNYVEAYTLYLAVSNIRDYIKEDVLLDKALNKANELESKIMKDLGVSIKINGAVTKSEGYGITIYSLPIKITNNSNRDIKSISGYYVAYDKEGYPIQVDENEYYGYFGLDDGVLKKSKSAETNAFPDKGGIESCKFLITSIEYLNGGEYLIDSSQKDKILESWQQVVIDKK